MSVGIYTLAGQAEIVRAAQRDEIAVERLQEKVSEILYKVLGGRAWIRFEELCKVVAGLAYYSLTTVRGLQTLGEEYTGLVQFDVSSRSLPSVLAQVVLVVLHSGGSTLVSALLRAIERSASRSPSLRREAADFLLHWAAALRDLLPFLLKLHKAAFYITGSYYHVAKRIAGVSYVLARPALKHSGSESVFRTVGAALLLYLLAAGARSLASERRQEMPVAVGNGADCLLCSQPRTHTATTPCGHLFCWGCLMEWLRAHTVCPLCREGVLPSRVVLLHNAQQ